MNFKLLITFAFTFGVLVGAAEVEQSKPQPNTSRPAVPSEAARRRAIAADAANVSLLSQEQAVLSQIEATRGRSVEVKMKVDELRSLHRYKAADKLAEQGQGLLDQLVRLKAQVQGIREQRDKLERSKKSILEEIDQLRKREAFLAKEIERLGVHPKGHGRGGLANEYQAERKEVRQRITQLQTRAGSMS